MVYYVPSGGDYGMKTKKELLLSVGCCAAGLLVGYCAAVDSPLDRMDAAKITGDELVAALDGAAGSSISSNDWKELCHRLEGRELTFHDLAIVGSSWGCIDSQSGNRWNFFILSSRERRYDNSALRLNVAFDDPKMERIAERIWESDSWGENYIRELKGRIEVNKNAPWLSTFRHLSVKGLALEPNLPPEEIPDFDVATITGDGVVKLLQSFKLGARPYVRDVTKRLVGRTLTFTNVTFEAATSGEGEGKGETVELRFRTDRQIQIMTNFWMSSPIILTATTRTANLEALPWELSPGERILRLSGRVAAPEKNKFGFWPEGIPLEDATFEVAWQNEKLPSFDVATLTGDELMDMALGFESTTRQAKVQRMLRMMEGRRLIFSRCSVGWDGGEFRAPSKENAVRVSLDFDESDAKWKRYPPARRIWAIFAGEQKERALRELTTDVQLTNVSGVVAWESGGNCTDRRDDRGFCLTDIDYQLVVPTERLPDFDAATITVDELSKMLSRRKTALTPFQIEDLKRRLAGRRLVFTNVQLDGASSYGSGRIQRIFFSIGRRSRLTGCKVSVALRSPLPKEDSAIGFDEQKRRMATYRIEATVGTDAANRDRFGSPFSPPIYMEDGVIDRMDEKGN